MCLRAVVAVMILVLLATAPASAAEDEAAEALSCAAARASGEPWQALEACQAELAERPDDVELMTIVAELEYDEGEPETAVALWRRIEQRQGWSLATARRLGTALWRAGQFDAAEATLRDAVARGGSPEAAADLVQLLLDLSRWDDATTAATAAITADPDLCQLYELRGLAAAGADDHAAAAADFARAVQHGCPPYRWATLGIVPEHLDAPPYRQLLDAKALTADLAAVDDHECELRLRLLEQVLTPAVAPAITDAVVGRTTLEVRYAGLGLLEQLGAKALPSWQRLLANDDFILRKLALRRIREQRDPVFAPLLEHHLEAGADTPGNLSLTRLALAELDLDAGDIAHATSLLDAIPVADTLYAIGRVDLADHAEADGDAAAALAYLEQALAADPAVHIAEGRLDKLRGATASQ